jgi:hypothetical protein
LLACVGVSDGVQIHLRLPAGYTGSEVNGQRGTLLEARRSRGTVEFRGKKWNIALGDLLPCDHG